MCKRNIVNPEPPENHYKFWQNEAMRELGKNYADCTNEELAELMGRTKGAITTRITILRIVVRMAPYADELLDVITKKKRSDAAKKYVATPQGRECRNKALEKARTRKAIAKFCASRRASIRTLEGRAKIEKAAKAAQSPEACAKRSASLKATLARKKAEKEKG